MNQNLALEILLAGESAFLTGPAGSGKTFVLNQFIKIARANSRSVAVTATTGLAASHLGGTTIHAWSGMGILDTIPSGFAEHMSKTRREIIEKTDVLIIDEISMLHDYRLDMVDEICRLVKKKPDTPFGGIQVVMSGDFFQLPPVNRGGGEQGSFAINSRSWQELDPVICYLKEQHRQDDKDLSEILNAMRAGELRRGHVEMLMERGNVEYEDANLTELYTTNVDVDKVNMRRLGDLGGDEYTYSRYTTGSQNYVDSLQKSILAPAELVLKKGAFVMAIRNAADRKYSNGSLGIVIGFEAATSYPIVEFKNGRTLTISPEMWELKDGEKKRASISQVPLRLAWAITVHKSQGMTLDAARMDLSRAFVEGMGYVALSRVRNLQNLYLDGLNKMAIRVSEAALEIDGQLRHKSNDDSERFKDLLKVSRAKAAIKTKQKANTWAQKIEEMRKDYPNAYKPWLKSDDEDLKLMFRNGQTVGDMSKKFGRHENSIVLRLQKHFGEDTVVL